MVPVEDVRWTLSNEVNVCTEVKTPARRTAKVPNCVNSKLKKASVATVLKRKRQKKTPRAERLGGRG